MSSKSFDRPVKFCTASYDHYIKFWDMNGSVDSHRSIQNSDSVSLIIYVTISNSTYAKA